MKTCFQKGKSVENVEKQTPLEDRGFESNQNKVDFASLHWVKESSKRKKDVVINVKVSFVAGAPGHIFAEILPRVFKDAVSCQVVAGSYCWVSMHGRGLGNPYHLT